MEDYNHFVACMNGAGEFEVAVSATPTPPPPSPPTFKEVVERVLEELANLPKEHQQKLYRFLHDSCDCRI